jgi:hypothetical protein
MVNIVVCFIFVIAQPRDRARPASKESHSSPAETKPSVAAR